MMREKIVFGPVASRRLGSSLGINLLPEGGKLCNFDCIYCECGWNKDGLEDRRLPSAEELRAALSAGLQDCRAKGIALDSITFSGAGEPTLHPGFPEIVDLTLELRDRYAPSAQVSVLSNATKVWREAVFQALRRVDNPILKLDAATDALARRINRPAGDYAVADIVKDLERFEGDFVLQTMFLQSGDFDSSAPENIAGWMDIVRRLHPREIMVYTIDREPPQRGLRKFSASRMQQIVQPLVKEGFNIKVYE